MKLLLVTLLVIVWFIPSPSARNRDEQTPTKNAAETSKTEEAKPTQPAVEPETMVNREPSKQEKKTQTTNATQPPHNWPERLNAISTVVIAIFAVVTAIAIICQVRTARSTDRAWMIGSPNMRKLDSPPEADAQLLYACSLKNTGRTPARILQTGLAFRKAKSFGDIPQTPSYIESEIFSFKKVLIVPEDSFAGTTVSQLTREEYLAVKDPRKALILYAYGFVKYLDVFGKLRETSFCHYYYVPGPYELQIEGFRLCVDAPPAYNKAT